VLCKKDDKWKTKLEELLQPNQVVMLLSPGDAKHDVLSYLNAHPNIHIIEMSTKYLKKREKEPKLKIKVKLKENRTNQRIGFNQHKSHKNPPFFPKHLQQIMAMNPLS